MKALVIRQPWAELIVSGRKTIEARTWRTHIQEEFLIVAGKTIDRGAMAKFGPRVLPGHENDINPPLVVDAGHFDIDFSPGAICTPFPVGMAIGIARVYKVEPFIDLHEQAACLKRDSRADLFAWHLGNARRIKPFAVRGMPGFFNVQPVP